MDGPEVKRAAAASARDPRIDQLGGKINFEANPFPDRIQEAAINAAIARAFRSRAAALRARAADGITVVKGITVVASEARPLLRFADDWETIAAELEGCAI